MEVSLEELSKISAGEGELCRSEIAMLESYIEFRKSRGHTLEQALEDMTSPEAKEYIKAHW